MITIPRLLRARLSAAVAGAACASAFAVATTPALATATTPIDRSSAYTYRTIDWTGPVGTTTGVNGINDVGDIVGTFDDANGLYHGMVGRADGTRLRELDYPGSSQTILIGISNLRAISGTYFDAAGVQHGFTYRNATFTSYDVPGAGTIGVGFELGDGLGTSGLGINDLGDTVGQYADARGVGHGFVRRHGHITTLDNPLGGPLPGGAAGGTQLLRVNDGGVIAGNYSMSPALLDTHPFLYRSGHFTTLAQVTGAIFTELLGLSNTGVASGVYFFDSLAGAGFLYDHGRLISVKVPWTAAGGFSSIAQPNGRGQIVGEYLGTDDLFHGYLATPR
jgi:hypothetical protein